MCVRACVLVLVPRIRVCACVCACTRACARACACARARVWVCARAPPRLRLRLRPRPCPRPCQRGCGCACVRIWGDSIYARHQRGSFDDDTEDAGGRLTHRFRVDLSTEHKPLFKDPSSFFFLTNLMRGAPNSFPISSCRSHTPLGLCSEMRNYHALLFY